MNNMVKYGLSFITGGVICGTLAAVVVKKKEEKRADEDIESMRIHYQEKLAEVEEMKKKIESTEEERELSLESIRKGLHTINAETERVMEHDKKEEETKTVPKYKIVPPEELWERDYPTISLTYYEGDKVLADESNKEISNVTDLVPEDFAEHFGEFEKDSVYVRNDDLCVFYEILKDLGNFSEN